ARAGSLSGLARQARGGDGRSRPGPGLPEADRQGTWAHHRAGGRTGPADRGGPGRRAQAGRGRRPPDPGRAHRPGMGRRGWRAGQEPPAGGQPPPGRLAGQTVHRARHAVPRPDPGGQPGPDPRGGRVRLHQGLPFLHVRHLVDPAGDHPGAGPSAAVRGTAARGTGGRAGAVSGLRVAVAGGGLGGLCLAQGLLKAGVDVTVYERDAQLAGRRQGYRLHVDARAGLALEQCLPPASLAVFQATCSEASARLTVVSERLRVLNEQRRTTDADPYAPATLSTSVNRQTLREVLAAGLDSRLVFGCELTGYELTGSRLADS